MRSAREIWDAALGELQIQISKPNFDTWLKDTQGIAYEDGAFTVSVPNAFVGEWLNSRLRSLVVKTLAGILGRSIDVRFVPNVASPPATAPAHPAPALADGGVSVRIRPPSAPRLNPRYTFDTFISGDSNRLPYSSALDIAENPSIPFNPLFIYGPTGLGKTHLLNAIGHTAKARHLNTTYITAEQFTNEFVTAVKSRRIEEFRDRFHDLEVFLLDDVQFLSGREQTQECLLHIFIQLHNSSCRIIIASDRSPQTIPSLDSRLQSRFSWGLVARIEPPDRDTRLAILQARSGQNGASAPLPVLELIANTVPGNVRELEGVFNQLIARSKLCGAAPDIDMAKAVIAEVAPHLPATESAQKTAPSPKLIIETVASHFSVSPQAIIGAKRDPPVTLARHVAMYLMRQVGDYRVSEIGRGLGNRDHSTVFYGCRKITEALAGDTELQQHIQKITEKIRTIPASPPSKQPPVEK